MPDYGLVFVSDGERMNFCLSDLVPPLRWSDAARITTLADRPGLPDAWWRSLPLHRVLAVADAEALGELLTDLALEHWPAAAVGDVLPALHVLDPDEADDPQVAIALDRVGSWHGLLALTGRELSDQPFIKARPVLTALFTAVFLRLSPPDEGHAGAGGAAPPEPEVAATPQARAASPSARTATPEAQAATPEAAVSPEPEISAPAAPLPAAALPEPPLPEPPLAEPPLAEPSLPQAEAAAVPVPPDSGQADSAQVDSAQADSAQAEPAGSGPAEALPVESGPVGTAAPEVVREPRPPTGHDFPALIDAAFGDLDDQSWMVAQNRVFTDAPSDPQELAKLLAVSPRVILDLEAALRGRLARWLALPEATPYNRHLAWLSAGLGVAAPKAKLVTAADWHERELRSLEVPAWQFVLATLPDHRLFGDWLVAGDIEELRDRTREVIAAAERPPTVSQALDLVVSLGVRPEVAKEWLESVPRLRARKGASPQAADGQVSGQVSDQVSSDGQVDEEPVRTPDRHLGGLKDVALTRRCFRQPDGRWWLRVDVSEDHLDGGEVPLPTGFAAYIGLVPGESRTVRSAAGEVALSWHARPVLGSLQRILTEVAAQEGSHIFLTLSDEGMLRIRHLPAANGGDRTSQALRLVGYTAPSGTPEQAARVIATRVGLAGPAARPELLARLRERGDRDLLSLLG